MHELIPEAHRELLDDAIAAVRARTGWSAFDGRVPTGHTAEQAAAAFAELCGRPFAIDDHCGAFVTQDEECSPYTGKTLGISYPRATVAELVAAALAATDEKWRAAAGDRIAVCLDAIERMWAANEDLALAAMHTTGQGLGMSRSGSGSNALDRGLEAIALGALALDRVPSAATWSARFGTSTVALQKTYRTVPLGPAVVVACASFPAWNVYPAVFANLVAGNPVIVKPHPTSVLQLALAVRIIRTALADAGFNPGLVTLATDAVHAPVTKELVTHPRVRVVDFTGSGVFGAWIERNCPQAVVYTETSGVNSVVIQALAQPGPAIRALAGAVSLFSAQMCTSPQNIYLPESGIPTGDGLLSMAEFLEQFVTAIDEITGSPKRAAAVLGAVQAETTVTALAELQARVAERGEVVRAPSAYAHPTHPAARTSSPLVARVSLDDDDLYCPEHFGPAVFVIPCPDADAGLAQAAADARRHGAITAFAFGDDEGFLERAEAAFGDAGAALSINVIGAMPMQFSAAYSDYHVSGLNPAGTATLTDESFVAGRFRIVQSRRPVTDGARRTDDEDVNS